MSIHSTVTTHYQCDYPGCTMAESIVEQPGEGRAFFCASVDLCDGKTVRAVHCLEHRLALKRALEAVGFQ